MTDPAPARKTALVLDVDGTLLDTVYFHVTAWWEAFREAGHEVSCVDIHGAVGRGSQDLVETLIGRPDDAVVQGHADRWAPLRERCLPFHDVPELIREVAGRGVQVVYCTSASPEDVEDFTAKIGCDDVVAALVTSGDVSSSKPAPDIVRAALDAVGVAPEDALMVGDTVFDVQAALAAGVACVALTCGGIPSADLHEAGAAAVYGNPSELLQDLDDSPLGRLWN